MILVFLSSIRKGVTCVKVIQKTNPYGLVFQVSTDKSNLKGILNFKKKDSPLL